MKHTPGPWQVERGNVGADHPLFVVAPEKNGIRPWCDADAHLIAAAPELKRRWQTEQAEKRRRKA